MPPKYNLKDINFIFYKTLFIINVCLKLENNIENVKIKCYNNKNIKF